MISGGVRRRTVERRLGGRSSALVLADGFTGHGLQYLFGRPAWLRSGARLGMRPRLSPSTPPRRSLGPMDLPEYAIEAKGLVKTYAATKTTPEMQALKGLDLAIPRGSIFGLLGPNGAGKSTFINILAGLCQQDLGHGDDLGPRHRPDPARRPRRHRRGAAGDRRRPVLHPRARPWRWPPACTPCPSPSAAPTSCWPPWAWPTRPTAYVRQLSGGMKRRLMVAKAHGAQPAGADPGRAHRRAWTWSCASSSGTTCWS